MDISTLSLQEKVDLLKQLIDDMFIIELGPYGSWSILDSDGLQIAGYTDLNRHIKKDETVIIFSDISTG